MTLTMNLGPASYPIHLESGALSRADRLFRIGGERKTLIVTDDGVPPQYAEAVAALASRPVLKTIPSGEGSKSFETLEALLSLMLENGFTRSDCAVAVGGGVVGDLAGFAASVYMRGIDFYNVPTTLLSQVDSSIGGKTAVNLGGVKNAAGTFWQPKAVLIDPRVLSTLPPRQLACGMAEAVKMAVTFDAEGFALFEKDDPAARLPEIIERALKVKKQVVEADEREGGLRRTLNFGHTLGHGIESLHGENGLFHGECVALGMLPMCSPAVRQRLLPVLERLGLPTSVKADPDRVMGAVLHDKKASGGTITAVVSDEIGASRLLPMTPGELRKRFTDFFGEGKS